MRLMVIYCSSVENVADRNLDGTDGVDEGSWK
jgi:hypothetical protein